MLLDFHTHNRSTKANPEALASYSFSDINTCPTGQLFTFGLHPWDTDTPLIGNWSETQLLLELQSPNCMALGEIGLDRLRGAAIKEQIDILQQQLDIGKRVKKPVVLHCVRAWGELRPLLRDFPYPKAIHGFRGNMGVLRSLLAEGWYISVSGSVLLSSGKRVGSNPPREWLSVIPYDRLLLETDDSGVPILEVYQAAARYLECPVEQVLERAGANIRRFISCA